MKWPKVFHRVWLDEPERPDFAKWRDDLAAMHPDWEIRTWDSSKEILAAGWMQNAKEFRAALKTDPFGRAPDILRYELLYEFGGVYIDTDVEPVKPFDALLADGRPFIGWEDDKRLCTAIFGAPPKHPAIAELIKRLPASLKVNAEADPTIASGPGYATPLLRERDDVRRLPVGVFYPVHWNQTKLFAAYDKGKPYPEQTIAVHRWNKGWAVD